jgi:hypothetical protein
MADKSISVGAELLFEFRDDASSSARKAIADLNKVIRSTTPEQELFAKATAKADFQLSKLAEKYAAGEISGEHYAAAIKHINDNLPQNIKLQQQAAAEAKRLADAQQIVTAKLVSRGGFSDDLKQAAGQLPLFGKFTGVIGPATAGLAAFAVAAGVVRAQVELMSTAIGYAADNIRKAYEALDETADAAEDLGIKANALRQLQLQAELAEVSTETLRNSLKKMMVNLGEAADDPRGGAAKLFTKLRLDATELANAKPEVAFEKIMTAIEDLPTRAQQLNAINDIFGRGNTEIIRLIGSYEKYRDVAKELATTLTDEQTAAQDEAQASFRLLDIVMRETWKEVAKDVIPAVGNLAKALTELLRDKDARDTFIAAFQDIAGVMKIVAESGDTVASVLGKIIRALQEIGPAGKALAQIVLPQPLRVPFMAATTAAGLLPSQQQVEALRRNREAEAFIQKQIDKTKEQEEAANRAAKAVRGLDVEFSALISGPTLGGGAFSLFDGVGDRIKKMTEDQEKFLQQIREQNELIGKTREEQEQIRLSRITALAGAMDALKVAQDERAEKEKILDLEREAAQVAQDQVKEAENLRRSLMSRDEKAQENIAKWRDLAKQGLLFDFELQKLIDRELGGLGTGKAPEVPSTLRAGSAEAYRAMFYKSTKTTDDILKRIEKNTRPDQAGEKLQLVNEGIA